MEDVVHAAILDNPPAAISTLVPGQSFLMASMSKVMAPGLRVGYLEASPEWLDKVAASITDCWMVAPLMPEIATHWLESQVKPSGSLICSESVLTNVWRSPGARWLALNSDGAIITRTCGLPLPDPWRVGAVCGHLASGRRAGSHGRPVRSRQNTITECSSHQPEYRQLS